MAKFGRCNSKACKAAQARIDVAKAELAAAQQEDEEKRMRAYLNKLKKEGKV